jgi:hypothetical protein
VFDGSVGQRNHCSLLVSSSKQDACFVVYHFDLFKFDDFLGAWLPFFNSVKLIFPKNLQANSDAASSSVASSLPRLTYATTFKFCSITYTAILSESAQLSYKLGSLWLIAHQRATSQFSLSFAVAKTGEAVEDSSRRLSSADKSQQSSSHLKDHIIQVS